MCVYRYTYVHMYIHYALISFIYISVVIYTEDVIL